jgi:eukaryotic-like serine/threonine-protein kinase
MTPERWNQVKDLLDQALSRETEERGAFLDAACASDSELRAEVQSLLSEQDLIHSGFLQLPPVLEQVSGSGIDSAQPRGAWSAGQFVAERFQLIRMLGEGGMGEVWLCDQTAPVKRQVALKFVHSGSYSRTGLQRFLLERQALALMEHPLIAKIFDAGTTAEGQPYLVMEYVPGRPITTYCDEKKLATPARLELFARVCEAVQHAHQKAIIHRDLKPSNILVVEMDGKPIPRVIDFGIAKILADQTADGSALHNSLSVFGGVMGTPGYISPEQADPNNHDIDTRADVYSLGVILYELLTGTLPVDPIGWQNKPFDEVLRSLREDDPQRPSARVSTQHDTLAAIAEKRDTESQKLVSLLRGDLDSITMKALEKDRNRRYATPLDFSADIQHFLDHRPVQARPASAGYRLHKYVRRNRIALIVAVAFAVVLVAAAAVTIRQSIRANREAAVAETVNEFLQNDLLAQAGTSAQSGTGANPDPDLKVRTALDRAAVRIEGKFAKQPEVEATIRDTIGWTYSDLGLFPEARQQLERALELHRRILGPEHPKTLKSMMRVGWVAYAVGNYRDAEAFLNQALEAQRRVLGPEHPDTLQTMENLALLFINEGKKTQAEAVDVQLLEIRKRLLGPEHPDTLQAMVNLARVYYSEGKQFQAEAPDVQILEIRKRLLGSEHPDTLKSMNNLASVYEAEDKYPEAEALNTETLEIEKRVLGPENPTTLQCMTQLAVVYSREHKYAQAEELYTQTLEIQRRVLGPNSPYTALTLYNLGCVAARGRNKGRAIDLLKQSVDHGFPPLMFPMIEKDPDLASLHGDPRFADLVAHAKQVAEVAQKAGTIQVSK